MASRLTPLPASRKSFGCVGPKWRKRPNGGRRAGADLRLGTVRRSRRAVTRHSIPRPGDVSEASGRGTAKSSFAGNGLLGEDFSLEPYFIIGSIPGCYDPSRTACHRSPYPTSERIGVDINCPARRIGFSRSQCKISGYHKTNYCHAKKIKKSAN
jgi:hypothetical protein